MSRADARCHDCLSVLVRNGHRLIRYHDLAAPGERAGQVSGIRRHARIQRLACTTCATVVYAPGPALQAGTRVTQGLAQKVVLDLLRDDVSSVASRYGLSQGTIRTLWLRGVAELPPLPHPVRTRILPFQSGGRRLMLLQDAKGATLGVFSGPGDPRLQHWMATHSEGDIGTDWRWGAALAAMAPPGVRVGVERKSLVAWFEANLSTIATRVRRIGSPLDCQALRTAWPLIQAGDAGRSTADDHRLAGICAAHELIDVLHRGVEGFRRVLQQIAPDQARAACVRWRSSLNGMGRHLFSGVTAMLDRLATSLFTPAWSMDAQGGRRGSVDDLSALLTADQGRSGDRLAERLQMALSQGRPSLAEPMQEQTGKAALPTPAAT